MNSKRLTIILFGLILLILPLVTFLRSKQTFSENENRTLAVFPKFSLSSIKEKRFMDGFENFMSDHFAGREEWIKVKNSLMRMSGQAEINGVFSVGGRMIQSFTEINAPLVDDNIQTINKFAAAYDIDTSLMVVPTANAIYEDLLPDGAAQLDQKSFIIGCYEKLSGVTGIDVYSALMTNRDEYIYYRTDHHWTSLGAYLSFDTASSRLGVNPVSRNNYRIEHASSSFRGTLYSKTLDESISADILDFYTNDIEKVEITVTTFDGAEEKEYDSLFFREYLDKKDKYSAYLGSMQPIVTVQTNAPTNKSIIIFKDSYANCFVQFLVNSYSRITLVDMRYINTDISRFINIDEYSQALFLYNAVSFANEPNIVMLKLSSEMGQ